MKRSVFILFVYLYFILSANTAQSQSSPDSVVNSYVSKLKENVNSKDFQAANETIQKIIGLKSTIPDIVAYYYGVTMFNLKNYKAAKDALYKFLTMIDENNPLYEEVVNLQKEAECHETGYYVQVEQCEECDGTGSIEIKCRNCKGTGKEFCPVCGGKGVSKTKEDFGERYATCVKCNGGGFILCTRCQGTKLEKSECSICTGKGIVKLKKSCE